MTFLAEWGSEIILSLIIAVLTYYFKKADKENGDIKKIDENFKLIIASYKYRLVQLCKELLNQGFMYQYQYEHLNEFYNLYHSLGGNGQAKDYYDKVCSELEIRQNPT